MKKLSIVYQTHWDREWYYTFDTYIVRLKKVLGRILELLQRGDISSFVFDGQVRALEDYLDVCEPNERELILHYVAKGSIVIGPWYVLADEFLVSGESLIRNLELGMETAKQFGTYQNVGYLPDSFGHISQMPQLFRLFELDSAIVWRGVVPKDVFFDWKAPNQDTVFTVYLKEGYYQPIIEQATYQTLFETFLTNIRAFSDRDHQLLTNGGDHLMPAYADIPARLKSLEKQHGIALEISTYEQYIQSVKQEDNRTQIQGELRDNTGVYVLPNVLSTRYYLKRQNQQMEEHMKTLEAMIASVYPFADYPNQRLVDNMWKNLLLNHPHDSICGCSVDDVHTEMETRTIKLNHQYDALLKELWIDLNAYPQISNYDQHATKVFDDYTNFSIVNPTTRRVHGWQFTTVYLNQSSPLVDQFVVSSSGTTFTTVIMRKTATRLFESPLEDAPQFRKVFAYDIAFRVKDLRGLGSNRYRLIAGTPVWIQSESGTTIENPFYRIQATDTGLTITDRQTNTTYPNMHRFQSSLDAGDEYNYSQPKQDMISNAAIIDVVVRTSEQIQEMTVTYDLVLPSGLNETFTAPSHETVHNTIVSTIRLRPDTKAIDVETTIQNQANNQRLRLLFASPKPIQHHWSDTAFDYVKRSVRSEVFEANKQHEVPVVVDPSLSKIVLDNDFTFRHIGLHEYQVESTEDSSILAVTMMRSVGHLSRDDMRSRGGGAGPSLETPDAQMNGIYSYRYSFTLQDPQPFANVDLFRQGLLVTKGHVDNKGSLLELKDDNIHCSSVRKKADGLEVRVYNPTSEPLSYAVTSSYPIQSQTLVNCLGHTIDQSIAMIPPKTIHTILYKLSPIAKQSGDVMIVGGSLGGIQAALSLLEQGHKVILSESTNWIGGQLTSQAVPLDEHQFIEEFGCTKRYRAFRNTVREYYLTNESLQTGIDVARLNPGNAWVTRLAFEPSVAHQLLLDQLRPYLGKQLVLYTNHSLEDVIVQEDRITSVIIADNETHQRIHVDAEYVLDATDQGDVLPLSNTEYITGRESKDQTGEFHATDTADLSDLQPVTHVVAMKWDELATTAIPKPQHYDYFATMVTPYSDQKVLSEYGPDSSTGKARKFDIYDGRLALWRYRRFYDPTQFESPSKPELTTINWPQNDYFMGNLFDDEYDDYHREMAKELTRCFVYYLQTEAPRTDGGRGYPEMQIAIDELGTNDGFAMTPYVRESRRIKALKTVKEDDVSALTNTTLPHVEDSIGIGCYHIDLHITTKSHNFFFDNTWPFEIPLGSMIPIRMKNLIPACKNIGTTHLTNGCFRLHPVEWNIGEVAGYLVSFLIEHKISPQNMYANKTLVKQFQSNLMKHGVELSWPEDKVKVI